MLLCKSILKLDKTHEIELLNKIMYKNKLFNVSQKKARGLKCIYFA